MSEGMLSSLNFIDFLSFFTRLQKVLDGNWEYFLDIYEQMGSIPNYSLFFIINAGNL
jgi:hypothetical protein